MEQPGSLPLGTHLPSGLNCDRHPCRRVYSRRAWAPAATRFRQPSWCAISLQAVPEHIPQVNAEQGTLSETLLHNSLPGVCW